MMRRKRCSRHLMSERAVVTGPNRLLLCYSNSEEGCKDKPKVSLCRQEEEKMSRTFIRRRTNVNFLYSTVNCEEMLTVVIAILCIAPWPMCTLTVHTGHGEKWRNTESVWRSQSQPHTSQDSRHFQQKLLMADCLLTNIICWSISRLADKCYKLATLVLLQTLYLTVAYYLQTFPNDRRWKAFEHLV